MNNLQRELRDVISKAEPYDVILFDERYGIIINLGRQK
jgi:hypothetical protein